MIQVSSQNTDCTTEQLYYINQPIAIEITHKHTQPISYQIISAAATKTREPMINKITKESDDNQSSTQQSSNPPRGDMMPLKLRMKMLHARS